jgi:hypothetical protein
LCVCNSVVCVPCHLITRLITPPPSPPPPPVLFADIASLYFITFSLLSVGFGDVHPITATERLFCCFLMLLGSAYLAFIISSTNDISNQINQQAIAHRRRMAEVQEWSSDRNFPPHLRKKLLSFFNSVSSTGIEGEILHDLSDELRNDIIAHSRSATIASIPLLASVEPTLRTALLNASRPMSLLPGDFLFVEGDASSEFFLLLKGCVCVSLVI